MEVKEMIGQVSWSVDGALLDVAKVSQVTMFSHVYWLSQEQAYCRWELLYEWEVGR